MNTSYIDYIANIYNAIIKTKNPYINEQDRTLINNLVNKILSKNSLSTEDSKIIYNVLLLCNVIYNNASNVLPIIDDEKYDRLINLMKINNFEYPIGAITVNFNNTTTNNINSDYSINTGLKQIVKVLPNDNIDRIYFNNLTQNKTPYMAEDFIIREDNTLIDQLSKSVPHKYNLCGTLDKVKFINNMDAKENGSYSDGTVTIFERDFLQRYINERVLDPNNIKLLLSLKYDGVSIETEVQGYKILSACTRGDMNSNLASDLTPLFNDIEFSRAKNIELNCNIPIGIKFECVITKRNLMLLANHYNINYVNARNAVIGLLSRLDARKYRDLLTLVPLETSLDMDRLEEINMLNTYYTKGLDFRYAVVQGNYNEILYYVKKFLDEAEELREYMNFMYDGIVIEILDPNIRNYLGRRDFVPRYAVAAKFSPMKRITTFTHYTFTIGQDGTITPIAHFEPVEFFGAIHDKTTVHSYERFKELQFRPGDKCVCTLVNDVIVYIRRAPDNYQDPNNKNPIIPFPTNCPTCGSPVFLSESQATAYCSNFNCPDKCIARLTGMIKRLGIKDFSRETVRTLGIYSFRKLVEYPHTELEKRLGPVRALNLIHRIRNLKSYALEDYIWVGSIGFTNIAIKTWQKILELFSIDKLINREDLNVLRSVKGIGNKTIDTIEYELNFFIDDLTYIYKNFPIIRSKYRDNINKNPKFVFSGFRDEALRNKLLIAGWEEAENVTKDTNLVVVPSFGWNSNKVSKAFKYLSKNYARFRDIPEYQIKWDNIHLINDLTLMPKIMTVDQINTYLNSNREGEN